MNQALLTALVGFGPVTPEWHDYQQQAAQFFRELGLTAYVDESVAGVRTAHDVDVLVVSQPHGLFVRWIVECKRWKTRVSKLHVEALRTIVIDTGADRGFILSEKGFQKGAHEAARLTNITLTSIADLRDNAKEALEAFALTELDLRALAMADRVYTIMFDEDDVAPPPKRTARGTRSFSMPIRVHDPRLLGIVGRLSLLRNAIDNAKLGREPGPIPKSLEAESGVRVRTTKRLVERATAFLDELGPILDHWQREVASHSD